MLRELRIENLLLIERAELRLGEGLNAITGETGAGKTVLAHSLDLLMGGKARPQIVRPGAEEAWVEGVFDLPQGLLAEPELAEVAERLPEGAEEIVLGRRVSASGRTAAFLAGRAASAADLKLLGGRLLAFYGQHEHRKLTISSAQMEVLDGFAGAEHLALREPTARRTASARGSRRSWPSCASATAAASATSISTATSSRRSRRWRPTRPRGRAVQPSASGCATRRGCARRQAAPWPAPPEPTRTAAGRRAPWPRPNRCCTVSAASMPSSTRWPSGSAPLAVELGDVAAELRGYLDGIEADPGRLAAVEERLEAIDRLQRKHGGSVESVLAHAERCRAEIERLEGAETRGAEAQAALAEAEARREKLGKQLSKGAGRRRRRPCGSESPRSSSAWRCRAPSLEVELEPHPEGFGPNGCETVELRISPNPGMAPAPLRDAASGGELSRVMLALSGLGEGAGAGTLVFDEIDAGVGGKTARVVGERLRALGEARQVLCITHLPQVASLAPTHFRLEKDSSGERAAATVQHLDGEDVVEEIRRMLGGESCRRGRGQARPRAARRGLSACR